MLGFKIMMPHNFSSKQYISIRRIWLIFLKWQYIQNQNLCDEWLALVSFQTCMTFFYSTQNKKLLSMLGTKQAGDHWPP